MLSGALCEYNLWEGRGWRRCRFYTHARSKRFCHGGFDTATFFRITTAPYRAQFVQQYVSNKTSTYLVASTFLCVSLQESFVFSSPDHACFAGPLDPHGTLANKRTFISEPATRDPRQRPPAPRAQSACPSRGSRTRQLRRPVGRVFRGLSGDFSCDFSSSRVLGGHIL